MGTACSTGYRCHPTTTTQLQLEYVHEMYYPMNVVKVSDILQMDNVPLPHMELEKLGLLHTWCHGMFTIFISHQWLGAAHPDPGGRQFAILRDTLRGIVDGSLEVEADPITVMNASLEKVDAETRKAVCNGYVFLDWFAIPHITARMREDQTQSQGLLAVRSIPVYVEVADLFVALVPNLTRENGSICNYSSWLSRGWCIAELWCRLLSCKRNTSVIVVHCPSEVKFIHPFDWQANRICDGEFTVEEDRAEVSQLGAVALARKMAFLASHGMWDVYRFFVAQRPMMLGQKSTARSLETFLDDFRFDNLEHTRAKLGMNGVMCAAFSEDIGMLRQLVETPADVNFKVKGLLELGFFDGQPALGLIAKSCSVQVLSTFLELGADVNAQDRNGVTPIGMVRSSEHLHVLAEFGADLHSPVFPLGLSPIALVMSHACPRTIEAMLSLKCDPNPKIHGLGYGPLHAITAFSRENGHAADIARLLLAHGANLNFKAHPDGVFKAITYGARAYFAFVRMECSSLMSVKVLASLPGLTPVAFAALLGSTALVQIFMEAGAEMVANHRGDFPDDLARANLHHDLATAFSFFSI
ncbi:ANK1 [Symbiodinium sp. CCMP2592]|nr:ANK1 [Symbiodinium sp. CCMP2592]